MRSEIVTERARCVDHRDRIDPYDRPHEQRDVTAQLAYSVARLTDVSIDDLLSGALLSPRTCPHCGRAPDFEDEATVVEDRPRETVLKLVR